MAAHPSPETFQLVRTLRQISPDGDSFTPSGRPVTGATRRLAPICGGPSPSRNIQLERKKNIAVCRYPQTHSFWRLAGILPFHDRYRELRNFRVAEDYRPF